MPEVIKLFNIMFSKKMSFYKELQLNVLESKQLIKSQKTGKDKLIHIFIFIFKVLITTAFACLFVMGFMWACGSENAAVGIVIVIGFLCFRHVDLDCNNKNFIWATVFMFAILIIAPRLSNMAPVLTGFFINFICLLMLYVIGCHKTVYMNHFTFILGYLLLLGYDVTDAELYIKRVIGLIAGMLMIIAVYLYRHKGFENKNTIISNIKEFNLKNFRSKWQLISSFLISAVMLVPDMLGAPKSIWVGIAVMSVFSPDSTKIISRTYGRILGTFLGLALFYILTLIIPEQYILYFGIIGGVGSGFSSKYIFQTMFNVLGALSIAVDALGIQTALEYRAIYNLLGALIVITLFFAYKLIKSKIITKN